MWPPHLLPLPQPDQPELRRRHPGSGRGAAVSRGDPGAWGGGAVTPRYWGCLGGGGWGGTPTLGILGRGWVRLSPDTGNPLGMVGVILLLPGRWWVQCHPNTGKLGYSDPPVPGLPRSLVGVMPPNTRAGPMQYPRTPFFPSGAAGTRSLSHQELSGLTQLSPTPCSRTWGFSRPIWLYHIPPLHCILPPKLGLWAEPPGQQTVKHRAWQCALCDTLGMCPGTAEPGAGQRLEGGGEEKPGADQGSEPCLGGVFWQQLPQNLRSCDGGFVAGSFFAVQILLPRAEKLQMRIVTEGVKLSWPVGLVPCNYSPYSPLYSLDSY